MVENLDDHSYLLNINYEITEINVVWINMFYTTNSTILEYKKAIHHRIFYYQPYVCIVH